MKEWIVREGAVRSGGRYLWTLSYMPPEPGWGIGTAGGGMFRRPEGSGAYVAEWEDSQLGAERFDRIDKAARAAKRCSGRIVALRRQGKSDG